MILCLMLTIESTLFEIFVSIMNDKVSDSLRGACVLTCEHEISVEFKETFLFSFSSTLAVENALNLYTTGRVSF
jgi:hypothetical protein